MDQIKQEKDVDGLHPLNVAQLANTKTHAPGRSSWSFDTIDFHVSCTPQVVDNDDIDNIMVLMMMMMVMILDVLMIIVNSIINNIITT